MLESPNLLNLICTIEPLLWFMAFYTYSHSGSGSRFRSFRSYLAIQMISAALLAPLVLLMLSASGHAAVLLNHMHTQIFWWGSIAAGVCGIVVQRDILSQILMTLVGLQRLAVLSLQWLLVVAFVVILNRVLVGWGSLSYSSQLAVICYGVTLTQLITLFYVTPFTFLVRRAARSRYQDILIGLWVLTLSHAVLDWGSWIQKPLSSLVVMTQLLVVLTTQIFWICCFVGEEQTAEPRLLPLDSRLVRWSEKFRVLHRSAAPTSEERSR